MSRGFNQTLPLLRETLSHTFVNKQDGGSSMEDNSLAASDLLFVINVQENCYGEGEVAPALILRT